MKIYHGGYMAIEMPETRSTEFVIQYIEYKHFQCEKK